MTIKKTSSIFRTTAFRTTALFISMAAINQAAAQGQQLAIEEILVTAQKRQADVMDVPVAIDVLSGSKLQISGIKDLDDLTQLAPSFNINTGPIEAQPTIRGIGSQNLGVGAYSSTAVYLDGVYLPRPYSLTGSLGSLDDIESLQVLKGPQGTIYGRNATAGALVITTRAPEIGEEVNGSLKVNIGDYGVREYSGAVYSGLTDTLAGSLTFTIKEGDGFIENLGGKGGDLDDQDGERFSAKLFWRPSDKVEFLFSGLYTKDRRNGAVQQQVGQFDDFGALPGLNNPQTAWVGTVLQFADAFGVGLSPLQQFSVIGAAAGLRFSGLGPQAYNNQIPTQALGILADGTSLSGLGDLDGINSGAYVEDLILSTTGTFSFDSFDLVGTGSYINHDRVSTAEVLRVDPSSIPDWSTVPGLDPVQAGTLGFITANSAIGFSGIAPGESYSGELYAVSNGDDRLEWVAGLYYFYEEGKSQTAAGAFGFDQTIGLTTWEVESIAPYVEMNYSLTDALTLTAGVRYTSEDAQTTDLLPARVAAGTDLGTLKRTDEQVTYTAKLAYNFDNWMVYGGYSTGFKSGSINAQTPENGQVDPEEISSLEVGFKGTAMDNRLTLTGAAFYYQYDNLQLNVLNAVNSITVLIDGAEAEVLGFELNADMLVADRTTLTLGATLLDHEYTSDALIPPTLTGQQAVPYLLDGNDLAMTPDLVAVAGIRHDIPMANDSLITVNAAANYNAGFWIDTQNTFGSSGDEDDGYTVVNTSVTYTHANELFSVMLYVNNLFDEEYYRGGLEAVGGLIQGGSPGRPRHFGATVQYNF